MRIKALVLGVIFLSFSFLVSCTEEPTSREKEVRRAEATVDWAGIEKAVNDLREMGFVKKINLEARKAWVDMGMWQIANAEQKESFTKTLALYCGHVANSTTYFIDIFDWSSGKKIAKYDSLGFKVY